MRPLFDLLPKERKTKRQNKGIKIQWNENLEKVKQKVLNILVEAVLKIPLDGELFVIETDASDKGIGAILSAEKDGQLIPIEFYSKTYSGAVKRWNVTEKEAYAIVLALKKFDKYIRGRPVKVYTDHEALRWFKETPKTKVHRWALLQTKVKLLLG